MGSSFRSRLWWAVAAWQAVNGGGFEYVTNRFGTFHCADVYSLLQFSDTFERRTKQEVKWFCRGLFVDVGANIGLYSVMAARNRCQVVSVEPGALAYARLKENLALNHVEGFVEAHRCAAWSRKERLCLFHDPAENGKNRISVEGEPVQGVTLDELLGGRRPELVKIDVEGSELEVLRGMEETLKGRPRLIFESWPGANFDACAALLRRAGYRIDRLGDGNWQAR